MKLLILSLADSSHLGRLDYASLSQQTLMEMVIDGITNREKICGSKDAPEDIAKWEGVKVTERGEVTGIVWAKIHLGRLAGTLYLDWLPSTVVSLNLYALPCVIRVSVLPPQLSSFVLKLHGIETIDWTMFPNSVETIDMFREKLIGSLDLTKLPANLKKLQLPVNHLEGTLDLTKLPAGLHILDLQSNRLEGTINLKHLPESLQEIIVGDNDLFGSIDLTKLPSGLEFLRVNDCNFEGKTDFSHLPYTLKYIDISSTLLEGRIFKTNDDMTIDNVNTDVEVFVRVSYTVEEHNDKIVIIDGMHPTLPVYINQTNLPRNK